MNFRNPSLKRAIQDSACISARSSRFTPGFRPVAHQIYKTDLAPRIWVRGAKRKSTVSMMDLPQGILPMKKMDFLDVEDEPAYPTVVQQARNNMRKFSHCVVLTRVGSFYELYFEQAEEYAPLLNLKLAKKKTNAGSVAMSGFPYFQLDRFLKTLVQDMNRYVAISEEFPNDASQKAKSGGLLFDRRVTRVITPGTLIDEKFMDPWENNFLLSIHANADAVGQSMPPDPGSQKKCEAPVEREPVEIGVAWLDLSSGDFFTQKTELSSLSSVIARIGPREIVVGREFENTGPTSILKDGHHVVTFHAAAELAPAIDSVSMMKAGVTLDPTKFSEAEVKAGNSLVNYVTTQLQGSVPQLREPVSRHTEEYMMIDKNSLRALEIRSTLRNGTFEGSLLNVIRRTVTKSGTRLLSQRLISPSTSLDEINERLDTVSEMLSNPALRENLVTHLRMTFDSLRIVQKFSFGRGDPDDLVSLSRTIQVTVQIARLLEDHIGNLSVDDTLELKKGFLRKLLDRLSLDDPNTLSERILDAIDEDMLDQQHMIEDSQAAKAVELAEAVLSEAGEEEPPLKGIPKNIKARLGDKEKDSITKDDVWIMRRSASSTLTKLHNRLDDLIQEKDNLAIRLREKSGAQSLTLKWTPGLGHICHIKGKDVQASLAALGTTRSVSASKSTRSFHLTEWTHLGNRIDDAKLRIRAEENRVFRSLRDMVIHNLVHLRHNASVLDSIDVACSFATLAEEKHLVRPLLNYSTSHNIVGGRHPTVEAGLTSQGRHFASNDCAVGGAERILLITGPNMAGKSTFLRQNALISILAQTGSYVPANFAEIGIVDKIFSRVGSADNLYEDQSTFMVEMLETASILKEATPRSFVIMDEVGRGTTPEDGVAVGYACLHHLYHVNRCRALFATHFHTLADMTASWEKVACYCTDVAEEGDGSFAYVHKLRKGVNRQSHALKVARLAGLPEEAIDVASRALEQLRASPLHGQEVNEVSPLKSSSAQG